MNQSGILLRFDDIHPEMNWETWDEVKSHCIERNISPIIAVIPENKDTTINFGEYRKNFWKEIKELQQIGWCIGLHGYQHLYTEQSAGIIGLHRRSEFSGLDVETQLLKIKKGLKIFREHDIEPDLFIAPSHSFDQATISALLKVGIDAISDGYAIFPYTDHNGMTWFPCQRWRFGFNKFGIWTVCLHTNNWTNIELDKFKKDIDRYSDRIISFSKAYEFGKSRKSNVFELMIEKTLGMTIKSKFSLLKHLSSNSSS